MYHGLFPSEAAILQLIELFFVFSFFLCLYSWGTLFPLLYFLFPIISGTNTLFFLIILYVVVFPHHFQESKLVVFHFCISLYFQNLCFFQVVEKCPFILLAHLCLDSSCLVLYGILRTCNNDVYFRSGCP